MTSSTAILLRSYAMPVEVAGHRSAAHHMREAAHEIETLRAALSDVRTEICKGPVNDVLWHAAIPSETTVDFICNTLGDGWDYDQWLEESAAASGEVQ